MAKKIFAVMIFCILVTGISFGQDRPPMREKGKKKMNPEEMVKKEMEMMKKELDLTETQETFIKKILDESAKKMQEQMQSESKDKDAMRKIQEDKEEKLKTVLTEDQWDKYKVMKEKHKDKFKDGDNPPPPPNDR